MVSYLITVPPGGSLPLFSALSVTSKCQLALLKSAEEEKAFPRKNVPSARINLGHTTK